jgi:hypothetical protein
MRWERLVMCIGEFRVVGKPETKTPFMTLGHRWKGNIQRDLKTNWM